ncbi:MAG: dephospho-CoA kinase [Acidobacteriaceae bacterium]
MLRVGLTGGLGSGKSTVASLLRDRGFIILEADAIARDLMQPGQAVYRAISEHFGPEVVQSDGSLDRAKLAELSFRGGRLQELTRIVHAPTIVEQERQTDAVFARDPHAVVVVESALVFEADAWGTAPGWRKRFDRVVLVTAPDDLKIRRFVDRILPEAATLEMRAAAESGARARLAAQLPDAVKIPRSDYVIDNSGDLAALRHQVDRIATDLIGLAGATHAKS